MKSLRREKAAGTRRRCSEGAGGTARASTRCRAADRRSFNVRQRETAPGEPSGFSAITICDRLGAGTVTPEGPCPCWIYLGPPGKRYRDRAAFFARRRVEGLKFKGKLSQVTVRKIRRANPAAPWRGAASRCPLTASPEFSPDLGMPPDVSDTLARLSVDQIG